LQRINAEGLSENKFNRYVLAKSTALETATAYYNAIDKPEKALALLLPFWNRSVEKLYIQAQYT